MNHHFDPLETPNESELLGTGIKAIHLYGSLEQGADEVGDVDLFVEFTTMDLGLDLQCEDMDREGELCEELTSISAYISPSSALDREIMSDITMRQVFPRDASSVAHGLYRDGND